MVPIDADPEALVRLRPVIVGFSEPMPRPAGSRADRPAPPCARGHARAAFRLSSLRLSVYLLPPECVLAICGFHALVASFRVSLGYVAMGMTPAVPA